MESASELKPRNAHIDYERTLYVAEAIKEHTYEYSYTRTRMTERVLVCLWGLWGTCGLQCYDMSTEYCCTYVQASYIDVAQAPVVSIAVLLLYWYRHSCIIPRTGYRDMPSSFSLRTSTYVRMYHSVTSTRVLTNTTPYESVRQLAIGSGEAPYSRSTHEGSD